MFTSICDPSACVPKVCFSGVKRFDEMRVEAKDVKQGQDYSESEDNRVSSELNVPRGGSGD